MARRKKLPAQICGSMRTESNGSITLFAKSGEARTATPVEEMVVQLAEKVDSLDGAGEGGSEEKLEAVVKEVKEVKAACSKEIAALKTLLQNEQAKILNRLTQLESDHKKAVDAAKNAAADAVVPEPEKAAPKTAAKAKKEKA